jgi:hypothetical protein
MTTKWDEYIKTEGWKDFYIIEAYQYIPDEVDRDVAIMKIEASQTAEEAKDVIAKAKEEKYVF